MKKSQQQDHRTYREAVNGLCLTMHTLDGSELTSEAQDEAENAIWAVAQKYGYVINIANT